MGLLRHRRLIIFGVVLGILLGIHASGWAQQTVPVRIDRYLALRSLSGEVTLQNSRASRTARAGDRLQAVGDGLTTQRGATARLEVDTGIGFVDVTENTRMRIRKMDVAPDNGRITHIEVPQGQVRLQLRSFTHEGSELEIHTPAGVGSVRGTEFGVSVQPDGKMGVATLSGLVETRAQGQAVAVAAGFQNLTIPGRPPSPATPLENEPELTYTLVRTIEGGNRRLQFVGRVDPVNLVLVRGELQAIDDEGRFTLEQPAIRGGRVQVTVITPLGKRRDYDLAIL